MACMFATLVKGVNGIKKKKKKEESWHQSINIISLFRAKSND